MSVYFIIYHKETIMPRIFNGRIIRFLREYRPVRRLAVIGGLVVGLYYIGVAAGWWPNILAGG